MANRWAFESFGRTLGLGERVGSPAAFVGSASDGLAVLAVLALVGLVASVVVLRMRTAPSAAR